MLTVCYLVYINFTCQTIENCIHIRHSGTYVSYITVKMAEVFKGELRNIR